MTRTLKKGKMRWGEIIEERRISPEGRRGWFYKS